MKAWVLHKANDFQFNEVDTPVLKDHEVLVAVKAVGICGSCLIFQEFIRQEPTDIH